MSPESTSHVINSPRRLVAILLADISGYSRLMGSDEEGTHARIKRHRREIVEPTIQEHYGRLIRYTGDGFLAIFESPLEAVRCAIVIQQSMAARNLSLPKNHWIRYRIGVNLGDVIVEEDDVYGEGVNIAARLEALADPGGVYISGGVYEQVKNKLVCGYQSLGDEKLKNITDPVRDLPGPAGPGRGQWRDAQAPRLGSAGRRRRAASRGRDRRLVPRDLGPAPPGAGNRDDRRADRDRSRGPGSGGGRAAGRRGSRPPRPHRTRKRRS